VRDSAAFKERPATSVTSQASMLADTTGHSRPVAHPSKSFSRPTKRRDTSAGTPLACFDSGAARLGDAANAARPLVTRFIRLRMAR